jgi:SH3-like domain-containing protein
VIKVIFLSLILLTAESFAENTALPIPRYVSLRANAVNIHVGPGNNYPIDWQYIRQGLPVEIIAEFDTWRQIRDWQGTQGWVHKTLLSGKRTVWILHKIRNLRQSPKDNAKVVAQIEPGVVAKAIECQNNWCKIEVTSPKGRIKGWIKRRCLWGIYPNEVKF